MTEKSASPTVTACHLYHRVYVGGCMDGHVAHLTSPDFPKTVASGAWDGLQRSYYVREDAHDSVTTGVYRHIGDAVVNPLLCRFCLGSGDADNSTPLGHGEFCKPCRGTGQIVPDRAGKAPS